MGVTATGPVYAFLRNLFGTFALPPVALLVVALIGAALAWRGRRAGGAVAVLCIAAVLVLQVASDLSTYYCNVRFGEAIPALATEMGAKRT